MVRREALGKGVGALFSEPEEGEEIRLLSQK